MSSTRARNPRTRSTAVPLRKLRLVSVGALVAAVAALPAAAPAGAQPEDSSVQYVNAVADASLVHLKVKWKGWIAVPRETFLWGTSYNWWTLNEGVYGPVSVTTTCSGFVASSAGDVVTAGHCVDDDSFDGGKRAILSTYVAGLGADLGASPAEMEQGMASLRANVNIEGLDAGSPPEREVRVTVPALSRRAYPASVVDVQSFKDGDVAVLSVTGLEAPALPVAEATPESGISVVAAGFSGAVAEIVDSDSSPTFNAGTISGTETINGTPYTALSSRTSPGMSGGPVLNMEGEVVGTVSWAPASETDRSSDFMAAAASIQAILAGSGVDNTLGEAEQAYRDGLSYFYESRYHDAVAEFDAAKALQPGWKFINEFRQDAVANYPNDVAPPVYEGDVSVGGSSTWLYVLAGGAVLILGAAGALAALVVRRRRVRPPTVGPAALPTPPVPVGPVGVPAAETVPTAPAVAVPQLVAEPVAAPVGHDFCSNCGAKHDLAAHYCETCGQPFAAAHPDRQLPV